MLSSPSKDDGIHPLEISIMRRFLLNVPIMIRNEEIST
jgi:hypothetical protein